MLNENLKQEDIEKIGWKLNSKADYGEYYNWNSDQNSPTLFVPRKEGYVPLTITKFKGKNFWHGHMSDVFVGNIQNITELELICKFVDLDNYLKGKWH